MRGRSLWTPLWGPQGPAALRLQQRGCGLQQHEQQQARVLCRQQQQQQRHEQQQQQEQHGHQYRQQQQQQLHRQQQLLRQTVARRWLVGVGCTQAAVNCSSNCSSSTSSSTRFWCSSSLRLLSTNRNGPIELDTEPNEGNSSSSSSNDSSSSSNVSSSSSSCRGLGGTCLKCQQAFEGIKIICKNCGAVLPPAYPSTGPVSAFAIFDLPASFDVNLPVLSARYKQLQQQIHPDKAADKSDEEQALCEVHQRHIAAAVKTLQNPAARAEHLLLLQGRGSPAALDDRINEREILIEVMQIHERLDSCKTRDDVDKLASAVKETVDELEAQLSAAIMLEDLTEAKALIKRLRLYFRVLERTADADFS
ncbi:DnaJ domain-containing protein, putative [Eimeria tenella]|uniref:DnaJ domain-containing protein, putative n=1 Tax=Eimeria tenella TaxID=5802 RepID=U6KXK7_EIMTE|nr:DnaJ domain-containing protein, putative [Eimeria tenella]CDJ42701.1 DnaJ domain-containing protein, putative [Eimeria tenella]|eukprot:XP_013233451.1 DnaJ domain-containing protein, putative [Eimeria tenella]